MSNNHYCSPRSSLVNTDRPDSVTSSLRTSPPVAFFRDGVTTSEIDLRIMDPKRRAFAIATAPRRNRYDDDDDGDNGSKKTLYSFGKTHAVPILQQSLTPQAQSLPQTQSGINLIPNLRVIPPAREDSDELEYIFSINSRRNRCSSGPLP
ncbi:hypothetical protein I4U23_001794 [Adineta vaga]|nr:hypothetical protein I4U23_001794 [Adineta vaga]